MRTRTLVRAEHHAQHAPPAHSPHGPHHAAASVGPSLRELEGLQRCACGGSCPRCASEAEGEAAGHNEAREAAPAHEAVARALAAPGAPLDRGVRETMEPRFRSDFGSVKVHTGPEAAVAAAAVEARAFTVGSRIVFGDGEYRPGTGTGDHLLAHELTHVVQQGGGGTPASGLRNAGDEELEAEAEELASASNGAPELRSVPRLSRAKVAKQKACIRPVRIADDDGKKPTTLPSFAAAKSIWKNCCVDLTVNAATTVKKSAYKTLDDPGVGVTPSAEETALFTAAGGGGGCISVFVPTELDDGTTRGKDVSGGGVAYDAGTADPKVVAVEGIHANVLAHEIGHALGYAKHGPADTVMEATGKHNTGPKSGVVKAICDDVRTFPGATAGAKADCDVPN